MAGTRPGGGVPEDAPSTFELQAAIVAAARASGHPVLDCGRGQPNWLATVPRAGFFTLGTFAVAEAVAASSHEQWGGSPPRAGLADRLRDHLAGDPSAGARFLLDAVQLGVDELGFEPDPWVHELVHGILGAGYPSPTRLLTHLERVMERYLVEACGVDIDVPGRFRIFGTEGGAAAMAYVFRTLRENHLVAPGDSVALATPVFTPYLQIPVLEEFGLRVVELAAPHEGADRFTDELLDRLLEPSIKVFFIVNPGNPDTRALPVERLHQLHELVLERRPDLIIVADTVYATFLEGFRSTLAEIPRNVICLHSFSKNFGATGNRLGFVAVHADNVMDELLQGMPADLRAHHADRYRSLTSDEAHLPFVNRLVADSREVALHNIAGLATPDQVQMALFALAYLLPSGRTYLEATRAELAARLAALLAPLGVAPPSGQDSLYYALIDLVAVARQREGDAFAAWLVLHAAPASIALRLASEHGVIVLPGQLFDAATWDMRISLASLTVAELTAVGEALDALLDALAVEAGFGTRAR